MPELPEVERARALIEAQGLHRKIAAVDDRDTYVCRPHAPGEIADALTGATLTEARRIGKSMWVETGGGPSLGLHLGMTGKIVIDGAEAGEPKPDGPVLHPVWDRFTIRFEDGGFLTLRDKRRLGRAVLEPDHSHLGPDAAEVARRQFGERVARGSMPLKARVMDQGVLAGVGNLLADETLWRARLSPLREAGELTPREVGRLYKSLQEAIADALRLGGVHTGTFVGQRRRDGACPRCGTGPVRQTIGGRTTWWCPKCQPDR